MRVPGFRPNYHNTVANRAVKWGTVNNPVNNCSVLFQLSNLQMQANEIREKGRGALRDIKEVPETIASSYYNRALYDSLRGIKRTADLEFIAMHNQMRIDAINFKLMRDVRGVPFRDLVHPLSHRLFTARPDVALALATPPPGPRMEFDWDNPDPDGSCTLRNFPIDIISPSISTIFGWDSFGGALATQQRSAMEFFRHRLATGKPDQDDK